jgi:hypothetical protein
MAHIHVLRTNPSPEDTDWLFTGIPPDLVTPPPSKRSRKPRAKLVIFNPEQITLQATELASNRVMHHQDAARIVVASFEKFRFLDMKPSVASEYILRMLKAGLWLNGRQYRFFGHGNSQLVGITG